MAKNQRAASTAGRVRTCMADYTILRPMKSKVDTVPSVLRRF
ncbi:MAG: hypothetical protein Q7V01_04160 [Vicinamibacterales bacterium]|nr:hypothetical protein [Vicinamibacterales bacterium]